MKETLELELNRYLFAKSRTIGMLYADGKKIADTLEDTYRELPDRCPDTINSRSCKCEEKVYAETCIPCGRYRVDYLWSNRYGRKYPTLLNVPHFLGILIHAGVNEGHTSGCILVGDLVENRQRLCNQFSVRDRVCKLVQDAIKAGKEVWITIKPAAYIEESKK